MVTCWEMTPMGTTRRGWRTVLVPCMIIGCFPDIKRRHWRSSAPPEGWDVLVVWMGNRSGQLTERIRITRYNQDLWNVAW
jgi:hypothetical protein